MSHTIRTLRPAIMAGLLLGWGPAASWAQAQGKTFKATAATVKFTETHGVQTQDYGAETVLLNDVQQVKK